MKFHSLALSSHLWVIWNQQPTPANNYGFLNPASQKLYPSLLLHQQPSIQLHVPSRLKILLSRLYRTGSHLQSHRLHCSLQVLPADAQPLALLLPDFPGRPGGHWLHGSSGHRLDRDLLPHHRFWLAQVRSELPLLQLHGNVHGLLWTVPTAAWCRHGRGALHGHQLSICTHHQHAQGPDSVHGADGVVHRRLHIFAAPYRRWKLSHADTWLLVFFQHKRWGKRHGLLPALLPGRADQHRCVVFAEHGERCDPDQGVLWTGQDTAPPRSWSGDDDSAHLHHGHRFYLLVPPTGEFVHLK